MNPVNTNRFLNEYGGEESDYVFFEKEEIMLKNAGGGHGSGTITIPTRNAAEQRGFVTAAHCFTGKGVAATVNGTRVGTVEHYLTAGLGDYCWVLLNNGVKMGAGTTGIQATYSAVLPADTSVTLTGRVSGTRNGTIKRVTNLTLGSWAITNGYAVTGFTTSKGDSGAPVTSFQSNYTCFIGMFHGSYEANTEQYVSNAGQIASQLPSGTGQLAWH